MPDTVGSATHQSTSLRAIAYTARVTKRQRFRDLYRCLHGALLRACGQDLQKDAASGVEQVTAAAYAVNLRATSEALAQRLHTKRSRAKLVRRGYMPKENGKERPPGIPARADTLVQRACAKLLTAISEQDFFACSYGSRPGRGALEAVRDLPFDLQDGT